ncbi:MAG TPA: hypothetical protein VIJ28_00375 [Chloroflexota bacterium]
MGCRARGVRVYRRYGYPVHRQIVGALPRRLLPCPLVRAALPTSAEITLLRQERTGGVDERLICHILHYIPRRRTPDLDLVEEVLPLECVTLEIRTNWQPRAAYLAPACTPLPVEMRGEYARLVAPRLEGHAMVVLERGLTVNSVRTKRKTWGR